MPSIAARSRLGGTIPSPIPGTPWVPHRCSLISGHSAGSTANARTSGSCRFSARATPVSTRPSPGRPRRRRRGRRSAPRSPRRSRACASGLSGFSNSAGEEVPVGVGRDDLAHPGDRQVDVGAGAGREHQVGAIGLDHRLALRAHPFGHHDHARYPLIAATAAAGDPGVAGGALDDRHPGLELAALLGLGRACARRSGPSPTPWGRTTRPSREMSRRPGGHARRAGRAASARSHPAANRELGAGAPPLVVMPRSPRLIPRRRPRPHDPSGARPRGRLASARPIRGRSTPRIRKAGPDTPSAAAGPRSACASAPRPRSGPPPSSSIVWAYPRARDLLELCPERSGIDDRSGREPRRAVRRAGVRGPPAHERQQHLAVRRAVQRRALPHPVHG